jgi:hypothetical protein
MVNDIITEFRIVFTLEGYCKRSTFVSLYSEKNIDLKEEIKI